jgi:hypothetical protein
MKILKAFLVYVSTFAILSVIPLVLFGWFTSWTDERKDAFCIVVSTISALSTLEYIIIRDLRDDD